MFATLTIRERKLLNDIKPWIASVELQDNGIKPIFKENTPENIRAKYKEMCDLFKQ